MQSPNESQVLQSSHTHCEGTLLVRLSVRFLCCLVDGERSRFLMRLVKLSPGMMCAVRPASRAPAAPDDSPPPPPSSRQQTLTGQPHAAEAELC